MTMDDFSEAVFEDPPPIERAGGGAAPSEFWGKMADLARTNPGQWLRLPGNYAPGMSSMVRKGQRKAFTEGQWDAQTRAVPGTNPKRHTLWIKYLGPSVEVLSPSCKARHHNKCPGSPCGCPCHKKES